MSDHNSIFYVYSHTSKATGKVFYIGKGKNRRAFYSSGRNKEWHNRGKSGFNVKIICSNLTNRDALDLERLLIDEAMESEIDLANLCRGGQGCEGFHHTPEHIAWLKQNNPMHRPEVRAKVSGENSWMKKNGHTVAGWRHKKETIEKIAASKRGKKRSPEMVQFLRDRQLNMSDETKQKIKASVEALPKKTCPHCGKIGSPANMVRWHFDNCKYKAAN